MPALIIGLIFAVLADLLLGDPPNQFHPVAAMGSLNSPGFSLGEQRTSDPAILLWSHFNFAWRSIVFTALVDCYNGNKEYARYGTGSGHCHTIKTDFRPAEFA